MKQPRGARYDIGELAGLAGLRTSALRYYERQGLLEPAGRSGGRRFYDERGLLMLAAIDYWQESGLSLREMIRLFRESKGSMAEAKRLASERIAELDRMIEHALQTKKLLLHVAKCTHARMDDCPDYKACLHKRAAAILAGDHRRSKPRLPPRHRSTTS